MKLNQIVANDVLFNQFLANAFILHSLKTPEVVFSGGIKWECWPEMG